MRKTILALAIAAACVPAAAQFDIGRMINKTIETTKKFQEANKEFSQDDEIELAEEAGEVPRQHLVAELLEESRRRSLRPAAKPAPPPGLARGRVHDVFFEARLPGGMLFRDLSALRAAPAHTGKACLA